MADPHAADINRDATRTRAREQPRADPTYQMWRLERLPLIDDLYRQRLACQAFSYKPALSIVTPVFNTAPHILDRMLRSVARQTYPHWQHCIVDDGSEADWLAPYLTRLASREPRIRFERRAINGGIVAGSNHALSLATGEFVGMLDHDDELDPQALFAIVSRLNAQSDTDMFYTDFDVIDLAGRHTTPVFKPDWSPELLLRVNYLAHFNLYRRSVVEQVGGWRSQFEGSQDYDLALRVSDVTQRIVHIPSVLYHWRQSASSVANNPEAKPYAYTAAKDAVADHLRRNRLDARRDDGPRLGYHSVRFSILGDPLVSFVIRVPSALSASGRQRLAAEVQALVHEAGHDRCEIVLVAESGLAGGLAASFRDVAFPARVAVSQATTDAGLMLNAGAAEARGDQLLFLSWPVAASSPGWLAAMLEYAQQQPIGAVGAQIFRRTGELWHGGVVLPRGVPHLMQIDDELLILNYSAVSRACLMTRRSTFDEVGGFQPAGVVGHVDFDYCLRLRDRGYRHLVAPHAKLRFVGPVPRDAHPARSQAFEDIWSRRLAVDPYYNPNFNQDNAGFRLRLR